jgi:hypothetical protein
MAGTRITKTIERLHAGGLPTPIKVTRTFVAGGIGMECSGCGEPVGRFERAYYCRVGDDMLLRFHLVCHETWVRFKPRT